MYVCVEGGPLTERERLRETDQTSTRLRETQPFYRSAWSRAKRVMERGSGAGEREKCVISSYFDIVWAPAQNTPVSLGFYCEIMHEICIIIIYFLTESFIYYIYT